MVGCSFQRWPSTSWSTFSMITVETRAKQLAKSCYIWSTATWCPWISKGAAWFHQLRGSSCAVPAGPIWEKQSSHGASFCKFGCDVLPVRWDAVFFLNVKLGPLSLLFLWQHLTTLKGQKCEIDSCKWSDLKKPLAKGAATDCPPFIDSPNKLAYLCRPLTSHIVIFSRLPRTPQVCHLCRIS